MPHTCVVPGCNGNYRTGPKVTVFKFPTQDHERATWIHAIKRKDFKVTKNSRVCELHFRPEEILRETSFYDEKTGRTITAPLSYPRLKVGSVPSQFPNCPAYLSSSQIYRESPESKRQALENKEVEQAVLASIEDNILFERIRIINTLQDVESKTNLLNLENFWTPFKMEKYFAFLHIANMPNPVIKSSVTVDENLEVCASLEGLSIPHVCGLKYIKNVQDLNSVLDSVKELSNNKSDIKNFDNIFKSVQVLLKSIGDENSDLEQIFQFALEQIKLAFCKQNKKQIRYSSDMLIFASLFSCMAPHAYKFVRECGYFVLPHPSTIKRLCCTSTDPLSEQQNFLSYIKQKISALSEQDKRVALLVDEIHIKAFFDYKGGNIVGSSFDSVNAATSAHVFMVNSISSLFKDVVHILPVKSIVASTLHDVLKRIIVELENIGFIVFAVISDNNSINRKAMSMFSVPNKLNFVYKHPVDPSRPLFFVVDTVHLLKCIRNNWVNQKYPERAMYYPKFDGFTPESNFFTASLAVLEKIHEQEAESIVKFGYNLSYRALFPSSIEKQNVKLVLQIFNEILVEGIKQLNKVNLIINGESTSNFIQIILTWWKVVNVKSPLKGHQKNDTYQFPITSVEGDERLLFLQQLIDWLENWEKLNCDTGKFTNETHSALKLTTKSLIEISKYCFENFNLSYVLLGKLQTDNLESRFSKYRQFSGGNYNISLRQIFEVEKKLRTESILRLGSLNLSNCETTFDCNPDKNLTSLFYVPISPNDFCSSLEKIPIITYIAGYCVHKQLKKVNCKFCSDLLILNDSESNSFDFIKALDRGKLKHPQQIVIDVVQVNFIVVEKLCTIYEDKFLKHLNQRQITYELTCNALNEREMFPQDKCQNDHLVELIFKSIIWASTNTFLNNFSKIKNDSMIIEQKTSKKKIDKRKSTSSDIKVKKSRKLITLEK